LRNPATGQPYAPATVTLVLGQHELTLVGVTTDRLNTFRVAIRPQLDLADPVVWGRANFPALFRGARWPVVLSHAGLKAGRALFVVVPVGTLFAGAHDHLRLVHRETAGGAPAWHVESRVLRADDPADPEFARRIAATLAEHLTAEETAAVGRTARALGPSEAAAFAVAAARTAAGADVAVVGATTFGAGLPAGEVSRFAFDACVRFDGPLFAAEVDRAWLRRLVARCNHGPDPPFAARTGENLVAAAGPQAFEDGRRYRFVMTDWIAKNAAQYLGENPPALTEVPGLRLKAAVLRALAP
jgi:2',3'-cyclic-nucleotide 2'-phosphodiesterase (5'-nucleotidase family)